MNKFRSCVHSIMRKTTQTVCHCIDYVLPLRRDCKKVPRYLFLAKLTTVSLSVLFIVNVGVVSWSPRTYQYQTKQIRKDEVSTFKANNLQITSQLLN